MKRNIEKDFNDYLKLTYRNKASLYPEDALNILQKAKTDIFDIVEISFGVGVMVGYRLAKRERQQSCCRKKR